MQGEAAARAATEQWAKGGFQSHKPQHWANHMSWIYKGLR